MVKDRMLLQSVEGKMLLESWVEKIEEELERPPALPWASAVQVPRGVERRELGDLNSLCNDAMNGVCNVLNSGVVDESGIVL
jgi:hypothetical protein